jgi:hypothetical protein
MVDKDAFINKIKVEMLYNEDEAQAVVSNTLSDKDNTKVSMKKLEELLAKPASAPVKEPLSIEKAKEIIAQIFDHLKRFIAMNEVNLVDLFHDMDDMEGDGYMNREEISKVFHKCRFEMSGIAHEDRMEALFLIYDRQRALKFEYMTFLHDFYQKANSQKVLLGTDSLSNVYESVRRYMAKKQ